MNSHPVEEDRYQYKSINTDFEIKTDGDEYKTEPKLETDEILLDRLDYFPDEESQSGSQPGKRDGKTVLSCDLCEYVGSADLLNRHRKAQHSGVLYPCDECDYAPVRPQSLKRHKESVHGGVRYPCDQGYISFRPN